MSAVLTPAPGGPVAAGAGPAPAFEPALAWRLNPRVAVRPEPFGALLYHFGTRKLSFLKNPTVVGLLRSLPEHTSAEAALAAIGITDADRPMYVRALDTLAQSGMIVPAPDQE